MATSSPQASLRSKDRLGLPYAGGWATSPAFLVVASDTGLACAALDRAGAHLSRVTEDGRLIEAWEVDPHTPNWISDVYRHTAGAVLYTDTKDYVPERMAVEMLRIVGDALIAAGVTAAIKQSGRTADDTGSRPE